MSREYVFARFAVPDPESRFMKGALIADQMTAQEAYEHSQPGEQVYTWWQERLSPASSETLAFVSCNGDEAEVACIGELIDILLNPMDYWPLEFENAKKVKVVFSKFKMTWEEDNELDRRQLVWRINLYQEFPLFLEEKS